MLMIAVGAASLPPDRRTVEIPWGGRRRARVPGAITQRAVVGLTAEPKVLALVRARFLWHFPYLERSQAVLDGVSRGYEGPPGPPGTP